ncbi:MAG: LON peptidase substrate-binding domain-containing protein [Gammaproteobacteria bacterium]|nr:LON peptidase substrate-binding domain-containing protein [Gammaproteobacteria bacterium]
MAQQIIPLFPLRTVLFPGGPLPLRIFETRYLDMISRCLREGIEFGVVAIRSGSETDAASLHQIGTGARIVDWYQGSDGLLGIMALGEKRFALESVETQHDGLHVGRCKWIQPDPRVPVPDEYAPLGRMLEDVMGDLGHHYQIVETRFDDASWVGNRLAEILPIGLERKQLCLELCDPLKRLALIRPLLEAVREESSE